MAIILDALTARLGFGPNADGPFHFTADQYKRVLERVYNSNLRLHLEVTERKMEEEKT